MTYSATYFQKLDVLKTPCAFTLIPVYLCSLSLKPENYFKYCEFFYSHCRNSVSQGFEENKWISIHEAVRWED